MLALLVVAAMVLAACGSDSNNDSASKSESTSKSEATNKPIKLVFLWEVRGESDVAVDDYNNGAVLAVEQINAAGGIDGRKIETKRISTSVFDMQAANAAFLKGLDEKPTAILGFTAPPQIASAVANITRGRVPLIAPTVGGDELRFGAKGGSEFTWLMDYEGASSNAAIDYMTGELKLKKVALMGDNADYGQEGIRSATKALDDAGLKPATTQTFAPDASDVTRQVLAVKSSGADGVLNVAYPNPLGVQLKQFQQNGVGIPTFSFGSSPFVVNFKMATGDALKGFYGVEACNFLATDQPSSKEFAAAYAKRFPQAGPPSYFAGYTYDMVHIVKAAIEKAGSSDPVKVNDALKGIKLSDGVVCGARYQADDSHFLRRDGVIVSYSPTSPPGRIVKTFDIPALPKA
jgi:ABC-type branched-subunit amino acid transport system substrate-binding protein